ncbi:transcription factor MYB1-like [Salvia miltiorrhiza]|uniref:transcription factor MYB1-like n=1 Tax=Salvia miltiorrhiza TaxID=226208 RepID=UPI0025ACC7DA|nr:transcription factor MYB1-like [Salvia miltiorrhiza]
MDNDMENEVPYAATNFVEEETDQDQQLILLDDNNNSFEVDTVTISDATHFEGPTVLGPMAAGKNDSADRIKGPWSPAEDNHLRELVQQHGARNWSLISKSIQGRSGKSCRLRWCNQLSPEVEHRPFTPEAIISQINH